MVVVPGLTAEIIPLLTPAVAIKVAAELHVPPLIVLLSVELLPWQMVVFPVMAVGIVFTVNGIVETQPAPVV